MIIKLFQHPMKGWLLIAEQLDDPPTWDRFIPCHSAESERGRFDFAVSNRAAGKLKLKACKELLKPGTSIFEYDWETDEGDLLCHAIEVAEGLECELLMDAPSGVGRGRPNTAA